MSDLVVLHIIDRKGEKRTIEAEVGKTLKDVIACLLYTSPSPRD